MIMWRSAVPVGSLHACWRIHGSLRIRVYSVKKIRELVFSKWSFFKIQKFFITTRNSSWGKVMFSQACAWSCRVRMSPVMTTRCHQQGVDMCGEMGMSRGHATWETPPPVLLTPSVATKNMHCWQEGGTYPIGTLSYCLHRILHIVKIVVSKEQSIS